MGVTVKRQFATALALTLGLGTAATSLAKPPAKALDMRDSYLAFLNAGHTPATTIRHSLANSSWQLIDPGVDAPKRVRPGDRIAFTNQGRTVLLVVIGKSPLATSGARMIAAHIDTPSPRLLLGTLTEGNQATIPAGAHGGIKAAHWIARPLALIGSVVRKDGSEVGVQIGTGDDDFAFFIEARKGKDYQVTTSSVKSSKEGRLLDILQKRYKLSADDLVTSELYLVPKMPARTVGAEGALIGAHGQDDRSNSFIAWRAISDLPGVPPHTSISWLVDREESGSRGRAGAKSHFLELVYAYLLRAQGDAHVTEAELMRALAKTEALSADTSACVNPNWPEVHEAKHGPLIGRGPAIFPGTGRRGKQGGSQAHAELVAKTLSVFRRGNIPVQTGELGRVDEGGGGTVAKYLEHRGIDAVDIGVCVIGMHSPFELSSLEDLFLTYKGFQKWFLEP